MAVTFKHRWRCAFPPLAFSGDEFADVTSQANIKDSNNGAGQVDTGPSGIDINHEPDADRGTRTSGVTLAGLEQPSTTRN